MHLKVFYRYVIVTIISFSLMGSFPGGEAFYSGPHNFDEISETSHKAHAHATSAHSHPPCGHEPYQVDSSKQCCQTPYKNHADFAQIPVLPNRTKTSQSHLVLTFSAQIATICFQLSEKNLISEIFNTTDPTLKSLRTVILLV